MLQFLDLSYNTKLELILYDIYLFIFVVAVLFLHHSTANDKSGNLNMLLSGTNEICLSVTLKSSFEKIFSAYFLLQPHILP